MFSFWTIARIVYSIAFALLHIYISQFVSSIEKRKNCPLKNTWKINNGKLLSSLLIIVAAINVFVPASKFLSTLPVIGSGYVFLFCLVLLVELFIINRIAINMNDDEYKGCRPKGYNMIIDFFGNKTITDCMIYTSVLALIFFYL